MDCYKAIGLLDSGVGGLTVVSEIFHQLEEESIVYFGDTARMPYGPRPQHQVREFVYEIIDFLHTQEIKLIIVACNSATAAGLDYYKEKTDLPVLGVIEPGVRAALQQTRNSKVGVIGTNGTIQSGAYQEVFQQVAPEVELYCQPCPLFVLIVENGLVSTPEAVRVTEEYLAPLKKAGVDTLIMGCTHYPLMSEVIQQVMGPEVRLISSAEETAREARDILQANDLFHRDNERVKRHRFFVSGPAKPFEEVAFKLLHKQVKAYQVILNHQNAVFEKS